MRQQLNKIAGISVFLMIPATAHAQPASPGAQPQPSTGTLTQPSTTTLPDEATPGRTASPGQTVTMPGQAGTAPSQPSAPGQTAITPGQEQTSPGQASQITPAVTGQTPSGQSTAQGQAAQLTPVTKTDLKSGSSVYDQSGALVGKIESVTAQGAVISTGTARATIPVTSFAKGEKGLVIGMSKAEINATAKKRSPKK